MRRVAALALIAACHAAPGRAVPSGARATDAIAADAIAHGGAVGLSVVILRGDDVAYAQHYGDAASGTVLPYASLSKLFWSTAIGQQVDAGRLDVASPVADVLPGFPDRRVQVRHLLTQTSGLGDDADGEDDERFTDLAPPAFAPGSWWRYSNRGAVLARRVLEQVAERSWSDLLAGLARTLDLPSLRVCAGDGSNFAPLHPRDAPLTAATLDRVGFVCGDALDAARFVRDLLAGRVVSPATLARMIAPVTVDVGGTAAPMRYGWLTRVGEISGHPAIGHSGNFPGVSVAAFTFPDDGLTIAVLGDATPAPGYDGWDLLTHIARAWLGVVEPTVTDTAPPADLLAACTGSYDVDGTTVQTFARDGRLWIRVPAAGIEQEAPWAGGTTFLGASDHVSPDTVNDFIVVGGRALAFRFGHPLVQEGLARRVDDPPR